MPLQVFSSVQYLSCVLTLCDPMNLSTPGLPVHHQLPEFTQTHVHWVGDAIQPSHPSHPVIPFSSCLQYFPPSGSFQMSQFFASGGQSIGVSTSASVQSLTGSTISICFFDSSHFPCTTLVSLHHILPWFEGGFYFLSDIMSSWRTGTVFS